MYINFQDHGIHITRIHPEFYKIHLLVLFRSKYRNNLPPLLIGISIVVFVKRTAPLNAALAGSWPSL